jgi:predicted ABC-type transport system involved in lysophospholipase L1 biosynthesis ATPase subunit
MAFVFAVERRCAALCRRRGPAEQTYITRPNPPTRGAAIGTGTSPGAGMELRLERIEQKVGAQTHLYPLDLTLVPRAVTVLLGATQAGKTTLMRVMAGLDKPSAGRVLADGQDVTGRPVRERNVAMVYQQFINYPSMTVADNIASPLKLRRESGIDARVQALAAKLHIEPFLQRLPAELSGGQQQRVALARALAKNAPLMLLAARQLGRHWACPARPSRASGLSCRPAWHPATPSPPAARASDPAGRGESAHRLSVRCGRASVPCLLRSRCPCRWQHRGLGDSVA